MFKNFSKIKIKLHLSFFPFPLPLPSTYLPVVSFSKTLYHFLSLSHRVMVRKKIKIWINMDIGIDDRYKQMNNSYKYRYR